MMFDTEGFRTLGCMVVGLAVLAPLGLWKLIEILVWLFHHVKVTI